jgi:hypothetical protein
MTLDFCLWDAMAKTSSRPFYVQQKEVHSKKSLLAALLTGKMDFHSL